MGALAGCGGDDDGASPSTEQVATVTATTTVTTASTTAAPTTAGTTTAPPSGDAVTRERAGAIAVARVGGVVDTVEPETDYGARWEVGVYTADQEYTVYVSADGTIVRVDGPFPRD
ncbi:MAG: hypothetical protein JHC74_15295 [Thermoleophilia bacterium]|nr:hypothetical protein [Thermoleophilia bacterium]